MKRVRALVIIFCAGWSMCLLAQPDGEPVVLDLDLEDGLLSMAHHIDGFLFQPTINQTHYSTDNLSARLQTDELRGYLVASALVKYQGKIVGLATEQEFVFQDAVSGDPLAHSVWLVTLNHADFQGAFSVAQIENAAPVFNVVQQVLAQPQRAWPDETLRFLSTASAARVTVLTPGLAAWQGAGFAEFNYINAADLANHGRFRARIQFVITPVQQQP